MTDEWPGVAIDSGTNSVRPRAAEAHYKRG